MTRNRGNHIRNALTSLISPQLIRRRARDLGVVKRQRKVDVVALVYTLVLGFDRGAKRSLASLRRTYASCSGVTLAPSAFYDRFTPQLAELMKQLTVCAFDRLRHSSSRLKRTLAAFTKVFLADGSVIRLHPDLEDHYPSVWTNHMKASAKLHVVMDGATRTPEILRVVPGSSHDVTLMSAGPWCRGTLFIFDLAYYQGKLFHQIIDHGGHFLCRAKSDANFVILSANDARWVGRKHKEILSKAKGKSFDVEVDYSYRHIPERDWTFRHLRLRLIAVWRPDLKRHRLYLTNASTSQLDAQTAPAVYALRWEIELLFRELKSQLRVVAWNAVADLEGNAAGGRADLATAHHREGRTVHFNLALNRQILQVDVLSIIHRYAPLNDDGVHGGAAYHDGLGLIAVVVHGERGIGCCHQR